MPSSTATGTTQSNRRDNCTGYFFADPYQNFTTPLFTVAAGTHTVALVGLDTAGGDNTALVDAVQLQAYATLTGTAGNDSFAAVTDGSNVDLYVNGAPGTTSPVQSVPASDLAGVVLAGGGGTDTFTSDVAGLALSVSSGTVQIASDLSLASLSVGSAGTVDLAGASAGLTVAGPVTVAGTFVHAAGPLVTPSLTVAAGGTFTDSGGSDAAASGQALAISTAGLFDAASSSPLAGATGGFTLVAGGTLQVDNAGSASGTTTLNMAVTAAGGTVDVTAGTLSVPGGIGSAAGTSLAIDGPGTLSIPNWTENGTVVQTAGTVSLYSINVNGTYDLQGGTLTAAYLNVGGFSTAALDQTGGTILVSQETQIGTGGHGVMEQSGGTADLSGIGLVLGYDAGDGVVSLSGGQTAATGISMGQFAGGEGQLDLSGTAALTVSGAEIAGAAGGGGATGTIVQTGGTNDAGSLVVGADLDQGTYTLSGGSVSSGWLCVGQDGTGTFTQSGGSVSAAQQVLGFDTTYTGGLTASGSWTQTGGTDTIAAAGLWVGVGAGGTGSFSLGAGSLSTGYLLVGAQGSTAGTYDQTGGTAATVTPIVGFGGSGTADVSGGSLAVSADAYVGYSGPGTLSISGSGAVSDPTSALYVSGDGVDGDPAGAGVVDLSGSGTLTTQQTYVGYSGPATFDQTGGTDTTQTLILNGPSSNAYANYAVTGGTANAATTVNVLVPSSSGAASVNEGSPYTLGLSATSSVGNNAITSWGVNWGDGSAVDAIGGNPSSAQYTYDAGGNSYLITPTAYGGGRAYPAGSVPVVVNDVPATVTVAGGAVTVNGVPTLSNNTGQATSLLATFTDPGTGETHTASINWGDGTPATTATVTESDGSGTITASHTYAVDGNYHAVITVADSGGATGTAAFAADVAYVAPTFGLAATPDPVTAGDPVLLTLRADGPDAGSVTAWTVDWGDNQTTAVAGPGTGDGAGNDTWAVPPHTYASAGSYVVSATPTDQAGAHADAAGTTLAVAEPAVTVLTATATDDNDVTLTWTPGAGSDSQFEVYRQNPDGTWAAIATVDDTTDGDTYTDTGLSASTAYFYRLEIHTPYSSSWSATASATTPAPTLAAPASLTATAVSTTGINLTWSDVTGETGFTVQRSPNGTTGWTQVGTTATGVLTYADTGLSASTAYFYRVEATHTGYWLSPWAYATGYTSTWSATASATTLSAAAPAVPSSLAGEAFSGTDGRVTWTNEGSGASGYTVQMSTNGGPYQTVATLPSTADTYWPDTLAPQTTYSFQVRADGPGGPSAYSAPSSLTTTDQLSFGLYTVQVGAFVSDDSDSDLATGSLAATGTPVYAASWQEAVWKSTQGTDSFAGGGTLDSADVESTEGTDSFAGGGESGALVHADEATASTGSFEGDGASGAIDYGADESQMFDFASSGAAAEVLAVDPSHEVWHFVPGGFLNGVIVADSIVGSYAVGAYASVSIGLVSFNTACSTCDLGGDPVRYADGSADLQATDLSSDAFGLSWGQSRSWTNRGEFSPSNVNGYGWIDDDRPYLLSMGDSDGGSGGGLGAHPNVAVVEGDQEVEAFTYVGGAYVASFGDKSTLSQDGDGAFTLTDAAGDRTRFDGFGQGADAGLFESYTAASGVTVTAEYAPGTFDGGPDTVADEVVTDGSGTSVTYQYAYLPAGDPNAGLLASVTEQVSRDGGAAEVAQQVAYTYYDGSYAGDQAYGNKGDLRTATVEDPSGAPISTDYYRYYTPADIAAGQAGYVHGLKYQFASGNYAALSAAAAAAGTSPLAMTDAQVAPYAQTYDRYDADQRITLETADGYGAGGSTGGQGQGTFTYAYATNPDLTAAQWASDFNVWATKTVETTPDGTVNTDYANIAGNTILKVQQPPAGPAIDYYHQFDGQGRITLSAQPSAVVSYDPSQDDLGVTLAPHAGLVETTAFYASTTATATAAGGALGYEAATYDQQGIDGTPVLQETLTYIAHTDAGGATIYPTATDTVYRNDDGTGAETTTYGYQWYAGTDQPSVTTVVAPGATAGTSVAFNADGMAVWLRDPDGNLSYTAYDPATGGVTEQVADANTADAADYDASTLPSGWATQAGRGLNLVTTSTVDDLGRPTQTVSPAGRVTEDVYLDAAHEILEYDGFDGATGTATGPVQMVQSQLPYTYVAGGVTYGGTYSQTLTYAPATIALGGDGRPTGGEGVGNLQSLTRDLANASGQVVVEDAYTNVSGITYGTAGAYLGSAATYYATAYAYNAAGRQSQTTDANGTITRDVYDFRGDVLSMWVGTSPSNLTDVADFTYDADGDQLSEADHPGGGQPDRVTTFAYDYEDEPVLEIDGAGSAQPIVTATSYDNLGEATEVRTYAGSGFMANAGGTPTGGDASLLRADATYGYDDQGRLTTTTALGVDPSSGDLTGASEVTDDYYDADGQLIAERSPTGLWTKTSYDGAGRVTATYQSDGAGTSDTDAATVSGDIVLSQTQDVYDGDGNVIETTTADRLAGDAPTATGTLGGSGPAARVSYTGSYYDAADRLTATVDVGTNGGTAWTRPSTVPTRSVVNLVVSTTYDLAGDIAAVTDPSGLVTAYTYDALGRTTKTIADDTNGTPTDSANQTTTWAYDGDGNVTSMTAVMPAGTPSQTTDYVYGVTAAQGSGINDNDLLYQTQYPDPTTGAASSSQAETYTYDALGEEATYTDRNGTTHAYGYDSLGRLTSDTVTTFGTGVDTSVAKLGYTYTDDGRPATATSYGGSGNVVNQTSDRYDAFGNLAAEQQAVSGAVSVGTPTVGYTTDPTTGRMTSMTYPDGRTITYNYGSGLDSDVSRLTSISDAGGTIQSYGYQGTDTPLTTTNGNGVTLTVTLDTLGRTASRTYTDASGTVIDGQQYTYDANSNVLSRRNLVLPGQSELYTYDGLNRLATFARGTLNSGGTAITGTPTGTESWNYDAVGNWKGNTVNGTTTSRTNSAQNQASTVGTATLAYDANGNTLADNTGQQYVYDAWNRLVTVKNSAGTTLAAYTYDAQGRRATETHGSTTTDLYYSKDWQVLQEGTSAQYVWSPYDVDGLVERDDHDPATSGTALNRRLYVEQDSDDNVTSLTNSTGAVVERYVYDPYGAVTVENPDGSTRGTGTASASLYGSAYLHQGLRLDVTTGTYDDRERVYDVSLNRFMQEDPAGYLDGANRYQPLDSSPLNKTDWSGLAPLLTRPNNAHQWLFAGVEVSFPTVCGWIGYKIGASVPEDFLIEAIGFEALGPVAIGVVVGLGVGLAADAIIEYIKPPAPPLNPHVWAPLHPPKHILRDWFVVSPEFCGNKLKGYTAQEFKAYDDDPYDQSPTAVGNPIYIPGRGPTPRNLARTVPGAVPY